MANTSWMNCDSRISNVHNQLDENQLREQEQYTAKNQKFKDMKSQLDSH